MKAELLRRIERIEGAKANISEVSLVFLSST
jgi:hypothetical protein